MKIKSTFKQAASLFLTGVAVLLFQAAVVQSAFAHGLTVTTATPGCSGSQIVINFTITSWDPGSTLGGPGPGLPTGGALGPGDGDNSNVQVFFNGALAATGAFTSANGDIFSGTANAPSGTSTVQVTAEAVASWGDGYGGGQTTSQFPVDLSTTSCAAPPPGTGRFTGGGKVVVSNAIVPTSGSVTVTKGFEVDCDMMPAHENLELNWDGGNHFHMNKITSAVCTLQGNPPNPPKAPVNRIDATGTGSYDGTAGYTVVFTLWDQGEPGRNDQAGFVVCQSTSPTSCTGTVVLSVPLQLVTTGNIQAHVDQK
jgi:hypothetical protein